MELYPKTRNRNMPFLYLSEFRLRSGGKRAGDDRQAVKAA